MDEEHTPHFVSTKVALFSADNTKVLVMEYGRGGAGLPGGHLEADETPNQAIVREVMEELGAVLPPVAHADFFLRSGDTGDVILGFTGIAPADFTLAPPNPDYENGRWVTREELAALDISPAYQAFVLNNWPN